jgi:NTP pyrophosphatase (non-canonical NTP hydrolase)
MATSTKAYVASAASTSPFWGESRVSIRSCRLIASTPSLNFFGEQMATYAILELDIIRWAEARQIIPNSNAQTQLLKAVSEMGELADATIKRDGPAIIDGVGDVMVCLIVYCALLDINLVGCMEAAYKEIKDRKGVLLPNGVFVKGL